MAIQSDLRTPCEKEIDAYLARRHEPLDSLPSGFFDPKAWTIQCIRDRHAHYDEHNLGDVPRVWSTFQPANMI